jgi:cell division septal protein FtsQ
MSLLRRKSPDLERHRRPKELDRSAPNLTYYSRRSETALNTGRNQAREALKRSTGNFVRFWVKRFGLGVLLIVVIVCLADVLSLSTNPQIVPLDAPDTLVHNQATYQAAAGKLLAASLWNRSKLTIDTAKLSRQLQAQFPELAGVNITLPLLAHRPLVYIQSTEPALVLISSQGSFVVGASGRVLTSAVNSPAISRLHLPVVTDQSGLKPTTGSQVLTAADVSFMQTIVAQLAARQFTVSALTLPPAANELDVRLNGQPYFVKFNLQGGDARQQAGTFLATQAHLQDQHITPGAYIDVRVDGRAYYK